MKKLFTTIAVAVATLVTTVTPLQAFWSGSSDWENFYVGAFGGANWVNNRRHNDVRFEFKSGWLAGGFVGFKTCQGFRLEGEVAYRDNHIKDIRIGASEFEFRRKGRLECWSYMANALYEMDIGTWDSCCSWRLAPFVGVGIGYANQRIKDSRHDGSSSGFSEGILSDGFITAKAKENGFAWQLIAGISYPFSDAWDIEVEYRFLKGQAKRLYNNSVDGAVKFHF